MIGGRRFLASMLQPFRQQLLHLSTTPTTTLDIRQASHGPRPTQAKILILGEYVFITDITCMFTHSFQLSVFILFHCTIHLSYFSCFLLVCLKNFKKIQKISSRFLLVFLSSLVVVLKENPKIFLVLLLLVGSFPV